MGLSAVAETAELFRQKAISLTERDREFVIRFAFQTGDMELTDKLTDELEKAGSDRDMVCRKYQALAGFRPDWIRRIENLLVSLETYRVQEEQAIKALWELLSACGISISEDEIRQTKAAQMQERVKQEQRKKEASL